MGTRDSLFIATILEEHIARGGGELGWLDAANATVSKGEDCGYSNFMETVNVLIMGKNTFDEVRTFGASLYIDKQVIVLRSNRIEIPDELVPSVACSSETPRKFHARLPDDGATIQRFIRAGLIDDLNITMVTILLGAGVSLFGAFVKVVHLGHIDTKSYEFGFGQLKYAVDHNATNARCGD